MCPATPFAAHHTISCLVMYWLVLGDDAAVLQDGIGLAVGHRLVDRNLGDFR
jgi:hypothetical protein